MYVLKLCFFFSLLMPALSANILALFPVKLKSHYIIFSSVMTELAKKGHNVTVVNPFPKPHPIENFTDIDVDICDKTPLDDVFAMDQAYKSYNSFTQLEIMLALADNFESIVQCEPVQQLLKSNQKFDLVMTEIFHSDVMTVFTDKFNSPLVSFCALPMFPWAADRVGNPSNPTYIRYPFSDTPLNQEDSTFYQRMINLIYYLNGKWHYYWANKKAEDMANKYLGAEKPLSEIVQNTSLILTFSHFTLNAPIPLVPNVIEISGVQIKSEVSPLPKEIRKFIEESKHGVIYFSMGSLLKVETMPDKKIQAFVDAFAQLPQRILWKWGNDTLPGKTDNIFIQKWMPQRDILAHPNIKLFISHGGALGLNEAVYEGVPILGIPMYADQITNLKVLQHYKAAEILHYTDITKDNILEKIRKILEEDYRSNMKKLSARFKDRPMSPMDTAIYWIEYIIRHNGAKHLRSLGADLPLYQYLLLDVISFIVFIVLIIVIMLVIIINYCIRTFRKGSTNLIQEKITKSKSKKE